MSPTEGPQAIIGAGMAGATCAHCLAQAGYQVQILEKSRGIGGRMTTRRLGWIDAAGSACAAQFDHGTIGFVSRTPEFTHFAEQALAEGILRRWRPALAPGSSEQQGVELLWVPRPDMPALCRGLLSALPMQTSCVTDALSRQTSGWRLQSGRLTVGEGFAAVVVAMPPLQAAPLLLPHQAGWAKRSQVLAMQPTCALMGLAEAGSGTPGWDSAWPESDVLACIVRDDAKPRALYHPRREPMGRSRHASMEPGFFGRVGRRGAGRPTRSAYPMAWQPLAPALPRRTPLALCRATSGLSRC